MRDVHTLKLDEQQLLNANVNSSDLTRVLPVYEKLFQTADDSRKEVSAPVPAVRRSARLEHRALALAKVASLCDRVPRKYADILKFPAPIAKKWIAAYELEVESLETVGDLSVIPASSVPPGQQVVPVRELFTVKYDNVQHVTKYKARICCRGDLVKDTARTFSPVAG